MCDRVQTRPVAAEAPWTSASLGYLPLLITPPDPSTYHTRCVLNQGLASDATSARRAVAAHCFFLRTHRPLAHPPATKPPTPRLHRPTLRRERAPSSSPALADHIPDIRHSESDSRSSVIHIQERRRRSSSAAQQRKSHIRTGRHRAVLPSLTFRRPLKQHETLQRRHGARKDSLEDAAGSQRHCVHRQSAICRI